jgi:hypothetical protein
MRAFGKVSLIPILMTVSVLAFVFGWWVLSSSHSSTCQSRRATADLFRDVIIIAASPGGSSRPYTVKQIEKRSPRAKEILRRIDQIRC